MPNTTDIMSEKEAGKTLKASFSEEDYQRGFEALERLRKLREGLPPVDAVALIREIRDTDGRGEMQ